MPANAACSKAPSFHLTTRARQLQLADYVFTGFFTVEMLLKIGAWGFMLAPNTYMRSGELCESALVLRGEGKRERRKRCVFVSRQGG